MVSDTCALAWREGEVIWSVALGAHSKWWTLEAACHSAQLTVSWSCVGIVTWITWTRATCQLRISGIAEGAYCGWITCLASENSALLAESNSSIIVSRVAETVYSTLSPEVCRSTCLAAVWTGLKAGITGVIAILTCLSCGVDILIATTVEVPTEISIYVKYRIARRTDSLPIRPITQSQLIKVHRTRTRQQCLTI